MPYKNSSLLVVKLLSNQDSVTDVIQECSKQDTSDPLLVGMTDLKIQACCFELSDWTTVKAIRFNETWYFDSEKFRFEKKVLGIGLIVNTFNDTGQVTGEKCVVYLKLNN